MPRTDQGVVLDVEVLLQLKQARAETTSLKLVLTELRGTRTPANAIPHKSWCPPCPTSHLGGRFDF